MFRRALMSALEAFKRLLLIGLLLPARFCGHTGGTGGLHHSSPMRLNIRRLSGVRD